MATKPTDAFQALMAGVTSWNLPKGPIPCELLLTGEAAFPVMVNKQGQVLLAASSYGRGRLVVMSHEGYLLDAGLTPFLLNAVRWLQPSIGGPVGVHPSLKNLVTVLQGNGVQAELQPAPGGPSGLYCLSAYVDPMPAGLIQFLKGGGGLLIGGQAWYWASQHGREQLLTSFPGNQVTSVAGVYFTDTYGDTRQLKVSKKVPKIPLQVRFGQDLRKDQQQLLEGISELDIATGGIPSRLLVHGPLAFPLGFDNSLGCFLAAAHYGRGRVVVAAHENLLNSPKMGPFVLNAVRWLAKGQEGKIGVSKDLQGLHTLLSGHELPCSLQPQLTPDVLVYCCKAYSDKEAQQLQEFVAEGGGLLIGGQSWWWASQHPGRSAVAGYPGNIILNKLGLSILPHCLKQGCFPVPTPDMLSYHFRKALSQFWDLLPQRGENMEKNWQASLGADGAGFLQIPAEGIPAYESLHRLLRKMLREVGLPAVSKENPVSRDSREAALLCLATELAHAGTDCCRLTQRMDKCTCDSWGHPITVEINGNNPGDSDCWVSTGLYLPNGLNAEVSLSETAASAGLKMQVGCHTDNLTSASKLSRAPVVTHKCCMDKTQKSITSLWGGLLYVILPKGSQLGPLSITIKRAVPAPYFKLGKTSLEEWRHKVKESQAPWGELATDNIILTMPSADLRKLGDPQPVLHLWDEMMEAISRLAAQPFPFHRPERIVADVQISAGWMHSGYPIMCHLQSVQELINETDMRHKGLWGAIHELGHNQQRHGWEFPPHTTEATCNLWSVYVHETVLGIPRARAHPALNPAEREKRVKTHLDKGAPLRNWEMWTALETYLQLQEAFGWDPFTQLFADYQTFSKVPKDNADKMNLWLRKFSEKVQKNLVPFFEAWGWPIHKEVAAYLASLPEWQGNPMQKYTSAKK